MRSSSPLSARSRIRTEGACGERASAADTNTLASATMRRISLCGRARRERRAALRARARAPRRPPSHYGPGLGSAASAGRAPQMALCATFSLLRPSGLFVRRGGSGSIDWRDLMSVAILLDKTGRRRSPVVMPGYRAGCAPANKGMPFRRTRPGPRRSSRLCARPARGATPCGCTG